MSAPVAIQNSDLDFDHGTFDSAAFTAQALAGWQSLAAVIDHSLVKPDATRQQVEGLCSEAARYRFASVVVNPVWTATAVRLLAGTGIPVAATIGFPLEHRSPQRSARKPRRSSGSVLESSAWYFPSASSKAAIITLSNTPFMPSQKWPMIVALFSRSSSKPACSPCEEKLRGIGDRYSRRRGFHQHSDWFRLGRRDPGRCRPHARSRRRALRRQGRRWHPHSRPTSAPCSKPAPTASAPPPPSPSSANSARSENRSQFIVLSSQPPATVPMQISVNYER